MSLELPPLAGAHVGRCAVVIFLNDQYHYEPEMRHEFIQGVKYSSNFHQLDVHSVTISITRSLRQEVDSVFMQRFVCSFLGA